MPYRLRSFFLQNSGFHLKNRTKTCCQDSWPVSRVEDKGEVTDFALGPNPPSSAVGNSIVMDLELVRRGEIKEHEVTTKHK